MKRHEAEKLIETIRSFVDDGRPPTVDGKPAKATGEVPPAEPPRPGGKLSIDTDQLEAIYQQIKRRLIDDCRIDPILLQLVTQRPEMVVEVEPRIVQVDGATMKGRVARLLAAGWFKEGRTTYAVRMELSRTGNDPGGGGSLAGKLGELREEGFLVRDGEGWLAAPGLKVTERTIER